MVIGLVGIALLLLCLGEYRYLSRALEMVFYLGCLLLLATYPPLRQIFGRLPRAQRHALSGLTAVILVTQVLGQTQNTFPFIAWSMYTEQMPDPPTYFEYVGVRDDGAEVVIPAARLFRAQRRNILWQLEGRWRRSQSAVDPDQREQLTQKFDSLLTALVDRFNAQQADDPVRRVRVVQCTLPRPAPGRKLNVTRRVLKEHTIE